MFQTLLNMLFGDSKCSYPSRQDIYTSAAPDVNKERATENEMLTTEEEGQGLTLDEELLLAKTHGPLGSGVRIELSLQEALKLFPRKRKRVDAYSKLIRKVREEYNTELIITSRKKKKDGN